MTSAADRVSQSDSLSHGRAGIVRWLWTIPAIAAGGGNINVQSFSPSAVSGTSLRRTLYIQESHEGSISFNISSAGIKFLRTCGRFLIAAGVNRTVSNIGRHSSGNAW